MAVLKFIPNKYKTNRSIKKLIDYIQNPEKTTPFLGGGVYCGNDKNTYQEFINVKKMWKQTKGRQIIHLTLNFDPKDKLSPELAKKIGEDFLKHKQFKGFQATYQVHTDRDHLHLHYVINTVNVETGRKWQQDKEVLKDMKVYLDELCIKNGLSTLKESKERSQKNNQKTYRARLEYRSELDNLSRAVALSAIYAQTRAEFFGNMKTLGYTALWHSDSKDIVFKTPPGNRFSSMQLKPKESFQKENLEAIFKKNSENPYFTKKPFERVSKKIAKLEAQGRLFAFRECLKDEEERFESEFGFEQLTNHYKERKSIENVFPIIRAFSLFNKGNEDINSLQPQVFYTAKKNFSKEDIMHYRKQKELGKKSQWEK